MKCQLKDWKYFEKSESESILFTLSIYKSAMMCACWRTTFLFLNNFRGFDMENKVPNGTKPKPFKHICKIELGLNSIFLNQKYLVFNLGSPPESQSAHPGPQRPSCQKSHQNQYGFDEKYLVKNVLTGCSAGFSWKDYRKSWSAVSEHLIPWNRRQNEL